MTGGTHPRFVTGAPAVDRRSAAANGWPPADDPARDRLKRVPNKSRIKPLDEFDTTWLVAAHTVADRHAVDHLTIAIESVWWRITAQPTLGTPFAKFI